MYSEQQRTYFMNSLPDYSDSLMQSHTLQCSSLRTNTLSNEEYCKKKDYNQNTTLINRCNSDQYRNSTKPSLTYTMDSSKSMNAYQTMSPHQDSLPQVYEESHEYSSPILQSNLLNTKLSPSNYLHQISIDNLNRFKTIQSIPNQTQKENKDRTPPKDNKSNKRSISANNYISIKHSNINRRHSSQYDINIRQSRRNNSLSLLWKGNTIKRNFTNLEKVSNSSRSCSKDHNDNNNNDNNALRIAYKYLYSDLNQRYNPDNIISNQMPCNDNKNHYSYERQSQSHYLNNTNNNSHNTRGVGGEYSDLNKSQSFSQINNLYQSSKSNNDDLVINHSLSHQRNTNNNNSLSQASTMNQYPINYKELIQSNKSPIFIQKDQEHYSSNNDLNENHINQNKLDREQKFQIEKEKLRAKRYENTMLMNQEIENEIRRKSIENQRKIQQELYEKQRTIKEEEEKKQIIEEERNKRLKEQNIIILQSNEPQKQLLNNEDDALSENAQTFGENTEIDEKINDKNRIRLYASPNSENNQEKENVETGQFNNNTLGQGNSTQKQLQYNNPSKSVPEEEKDYQEQEGDSQSKLKLKGKTQLGKLLKSENCNNTSHSPSKSKTNISKESNKEAENIIISSPLKKTSSFKKSLKKLANSLQNNKSNDDMTADEEDEDNKDEEEDDDDDENCKIHSFQKKLLDCINKIGKKDETSPCHNNDKQDKFYSKAQKIKEALSKSTINNQFINIDKTYSPNKLPQFQSKLDQIPLFLHKCNEQNDSFYQSNKNIRQSTYGNESLLTKIPSHYKQCLMPLKKPKIFFKSIEKNIPWTSHRSNTEFYSISSSTVMPPNPYDTVVKAREYFFVEDT